MICPITDKPCRTNGCGEKCYKRDSLGYSTAPKHDAKLPVGSSVLSDWNEKVKRVEKDFKVAFANLVNSNEYKKMIDGLKRIGAIR